MENLFTIETHLHTAQGSACAVSTGEEMARAHKAAGYDAIILTDHFFGGNTAEPRDLPWAERIERYCAGYEQARAVGEGHRPESVLRHRVGLARPRSF